MSNLVAKLLFNIMENATRMPSKKVNQASSTLRAYACHGVVFVYARKTRNPIFVATNRATSKKLNRKNKNQSKGKHEQIIYHYTDPGDAGKHINEVKKLVVTRIQRTASDFLPPSWVYNSSNIYHIIEKSKNTRRHALITHATE